MKNRSVVAMAIVAVAGLASNAMADGRVTTNANPGGSGGRYDGTDGSGGAFEITPTTGSHVNQNNSGYNGELGGLGLTNSFYSFCIERTEFLGSPQFTEISTSSSGGGISGQDQTGTDPLDARTAVLYQEFRNNGNYGGVGNIGSSSVVVGKGLTSSVQHAIWFIEGELTLAQYSGDTDAVAMVAWAQAQVNAGAGIGNVRVLRLWANHSTTTGAYSGFGQDVLTLIPLPPAAWAGLGSLACVGLFGMIRRRKNAAV